MTAAEFKVFLNENGVSGSWSDRIYKTLDTWCKNFNCECPKYI